ncbi:kinase-like protein [Artomyces pyxidatus]|uniref:Kinase-like protein n=1 Tax=Artomyces pyxidatus TaxID=48021 RepID=A0ACB8T2Q4_9AGAM|nr:kinase-like protein [Artomyces pyxidatus]
MDSSSHPRRASSYPFTRDVPFVAVAFPSITITNSFAQHDDTNTSSRSFTPLKAIGDGTFSTIWLCDWHGELLPGTPLLAMQYDPGHRPEYADRRLVAVKRMKRQWEGSWLGCTRLKELIALREIPIHPNIVPLYDCFLVPETKELFFVFEPMEGNLYQLMKSRKGRNFAGGLVASIFRQIVSGLSHIHASGFFHRDIKPENILATTTGLRDYHNASSSGLPERDFEIVIKITDFGLARKTTSRPPYTEYVSVRWYRAPEVLLKSRDYSSPVDMWALGTVMAELLNLRPLFPGKGELDQMYQITAILGYPSCAYVVQTPNVVLGGGEWVDGIRLAHGLGFQFPQTPPVNMAPLFHSNVPRRLVQCIAGLLQYNPAARLTSAKCLKHAYLRQMAALEALPPRPPPPACGPYPDLHIRRLVHKTADPLGQLARSIDAPMEPAHSDSSRASSGGSSASTKVDEDAPKALQSSESWLTRWGKTAGSWVSSALGLWKPGPLRMLGDKEEKPEEKPQQDEKEVDDFPWGLQPL